jgi:hypothetical protein
MADNVNIIVQDTINDIVVNAAVVVETIDINVQAAVDVVDIVANPNNYVVNINRIIGEQVQSDWDQNDNQAPDYIKNKPSIPTLTSDLTNDGSDGVNPFITAADVTPQVNSDWNATSGVAQILNKPTLATVATSGSYNDLINKPTIPAAQVNSDWNATSGVAEILNKPTIPAAVTKTSDLINDGENGVNPFITAADIPPVTGFVPYTGATSNVDLGTHTLSAKDLVINHSSGSGVAASITKGGAGEALTINKTSGSGNAMSVTGGVTQLDELHLTTDLADSYIASAVTWNGKFTLPALTSGSVLFSDGTTIAQKNAQLFWDNTNNRLGIGTATPAYKLTVAGTIDAGTNLIGSGIWNQGIQPLGGTGEFRFVNSTGNGFFFTWVQNNGLERMRLSSNNNLLVGTTTDAGFRLDVNGTARISGNTTIVAATPVLNINVTGNNQSSALYFNALDGTPRAGILANLASGEIRYFVGIGGYFPTFYSNNSERMRIPTTGNVLINTTTDIASSQLTIASTTKGFLPPRMTTTQKNAIATPAAGLMVYDTTLNLISVYNGTIWISL